VIKTVQISKQAQKQIEKVPSYIADKLLGWVLDLQARGLEEVRKTPGFHDEPLRGKLAGMRSIRLSRGYRAYYQIIHDRIEFVRIEGVDKHEY
jgi:proteic killer suppression protein